MIYYRKIRIFSPLNKIFGSIQQDLKLRDQELIIFIKINKKLRNIRPINIFECMSIGRAAYLVTHLSQMRMIVYYCFPGFFRNKTLKVS